MVFCTIVDQLRECKSCWALIHNCKPLIPNHVLYKGRSTKRDVDHVRYQYTVVNL